MKACRIRRRQLRRESPVVTAAVLGRRWSRARCGLMGRHGGGSCTMAFGCHVKMPVRDVLISVPREAGWVLLMGHVLWLWVRDVLWLVKRRTVLKAMVVVRAGAGLKASLGTF